LEVKEIFSGSFALYYEKVINRLSSPIYVNRWRRALIKGALTFCPEPKVVVDCCCGAGSVGELFLKEKRGALLINCDISKELLRMAVENLGSKAYYLQSDNRFFPLKGGAVDILFSSFCVRNSQEVEKTVKEALRTLKPGGVWAILDFFKLDRKSLSSLANQTVFKSFMKLNGLISQENRRAIDYLFKSIDKFKSVKAFKELLEDSQFEVAEVKNFMGGVASSVIAIKREV